MKKFLSSIAVILLIGVTMTSCNSNNPKSVAKRFLTDLYKLDFDGAKQLSTEDTKNMLDMFQQLSTAMPDSSKQELKSIRVDIKDVKTEDTTSTVTFATSDNPKDQTLHLVKRDKKWLVEWSKEDQLNNAGTLPEDQPTDGPAASDTASSTETPVDTTIIK